MNTGHNARKQEFTKVRNKLKDGCRVKGNTGEILQ